MPSRSDARIAVPPLPPRCIPRPRLVDALTAATDRSLTLIAAGAGSGKTVLLSEWAAARPVAPAWLSLGRADNAPSRFWPLVGSALRIAGIDGVTTEFLAAPSLSIDDDMRVIEPYLSSLANGHPPVYLILDNAHVLTHPAVLDGLDSLLRGSGRRLHLILSARSDPLLPLHRYRLAGRMAELRARDLAMTQDETRALLLAHDITLPAREFTVLTARTEGWAAGLRLSAMSMEGAEHPEEFVTEFAIDQGSVGEYLMNEVLGRQPEQVRTLLIETSFLPEITADLAEAVTGFSGAGETLSKLSRTNTFVLPLDRTSQRFRYHRMLREILRYLLHREPLQRRRELLDRASQWYQERGELGEAFRLAVNGQDWPRVAAMLVNGGFAQAFIAHADLSFLKASDLRPIDGPDSCDLCLARAALLAAGGNPVAAQHELDEARLAYQAPRDGDQSLTVAVTELLIARSLHRVHDLEGLASAVLATSPDDDPPAALTAAVLLEQGCAQFWAAEYDATERLLSDAMEYARRAADAQLELRCVSQLALVHAYWGRFHSVDADQARASVLLRHDPKQETPTSLHLALTIRAFYRADFEASFESLRNAEATLGSELDDDIRAAVPMMRGLLLAGVGQVGPLSRHLRRGAEPRGAMIEDFRVTLLADIETSLGRPTAALAQLREHASTPPSAATSLAVSRAHLALGDPRNAADALRAILAGADHYAPRSLVIGALITQAQVAVAVDQEARGVECLVRACELAGREIVLPFIRVSDDFRDLAARHSSLAAIWPAGPGSALVAPLEVSIVIPPTRLPEPLPIESAPFCGGSRRRCRPPRSLLSCACR